MDQQKLMLYLENKIMAYEEEEVKLAKQKYVRALSFVKGCKEALYDLKWDILNNKI